MAGEGVDILQEVLDSSSATAAHIADLWEKWDGQKSGWKSQVQDVISMVYAESTRDTANGANFENSTHRPKLAQIYDNLVANYESGLLPNKNWLKLMNESQSGFENSEQRQKALAYLTTKHRLSKFNITVASLIDDWVLYGNAFSMVYYTNEQASEDNPWGQYELNYKGPVVRRISPYDIVFNPLASSFEKSPKIIRSLKNIGELIRDAQDNPADGWKMDVVDQLIAQRKTLAGVEDIDKSIQLKIDGFGSYSEYIGSDVVEILELYGDIYDPTTGDFQRDMVMTVADRRLLIRSEPLKNWTGKPRIHHTGWRDRKDNLWAMGPLENLVGMQFRINHLENARADAFDDMIYGDIVQTGNVEASQNPDGSTTYIVSEGGGISRFAPDTTILNADLQIRELEAEMDLYAGSPRDAAGFRTPGEKTKFEVSMLANAAGRIFQHKMTKFEITMLEEIVNSEIMVAHQGLSGTEEVRSDTGDEGIPEFLDITKEDLLINGKVVPIGARHFAKQAQLASDLGGFIQVLQSDPEVKEHVSSVRLAKIYESVLDLEEFGLIEPHIRIDERTENQRKAQVAQQSLAEEGAGDDELGEGGVL
jgi:hypothetical protein